MDVKQIEGPIAIIGGGVMGETMVSGLIAAGVAPHRLRVADPDEARLGALQERYGVATAASNGDAVFEAAIVLLVVKPRMILSVLVEIADVLEPDTLVISLAAGVELAKLQGALKSGSPVVRVMPNTPAKVRAGMSAICPGRHVSADQVALVQTLMGAVGSVVLVDEHDFDAVTAVSGSGPAYVFLVAEAMADAGVELGLTRDVATALAVQTMVGSAQLMAQTGVHPAVLRNQVTSPGGTTAAALAQLEAHGLRAAFADAMRACVARSVAMGQ